LEEVGDYVAKEKTPEESFKDFINGLEFDLPEKGLLTPEIENIVDDTGEQNGSVMKITFDLHLFMNHRQVKYYMLANNQKMQILGEMSLKDALAKFNSKQQRKRK
jgi:hypothetical protein